MPSLIPGFEYDIFISYRQKDNKYDGWVTEFVDHLKKELEATFKDEISVYFDINPHEGLLETHDVDASLKDKLKCLIFIPIISRTYCDPNSFAWEHEFKAFVEQASQDQFGLKVKLPNGNVASRVLPIRIHDLDVDDIRLFESVLGGVLRGIEFIYKEPGVNRPLRSNEENPHGNLNHTIYRNQINKVALAAKDIIESMKSPAASDKSKVKEIWVKHEIKGKLQSEKLKPQQEKEIRPSTVRTKILVPGILIMLAFLVAAVLLFNHRAKVKWAKEKALPEIGKFYDESNFVQAYNLVRKAERYIAKDPELKEWISKVVTKVTILTDPSGADVYIREYSNTAGLWQKLGQTPLDSIELPISTFYRIRIEKPGYETVFAATSSDLDNLSRRLFKQGVIPSRMVFVEGYWDEVLDTFETDKGFYIDKFEVTNKQYKEFVDKGGYRNRDYWKNEFIKEGKKLSWEEAMSEFTDKTGRPGPSTWEAGDYPEGQDDYPVSGVGWYEAAAYAEFIGKVLPTADHWDSSVGFYENHIYQYFGPKIYPISNFNGTGPVLVGLNQGISCYGAYDVAGNVREWCWNETNFGRIVSGGGYADANYMFTQWDQLPPFDRSSINGFRCAIYIDREKIQETAFRLIEMDKWEERDYRLETPVPGSTFLSYKIQFLYDKTELNSVIEERDESPDDWTIEKVSFNAAYGNERMIAYLFLPINSSPPYQTLIFFPGSYAVEAKDLKTEGAVNAYLDFVLKSGRVVVYPVYFRTYERNDGKSDIYPAESHQYTEDLIKWVKDFSRTIDYLETRIDIDTSKLGFYGHSWGGRLGGIIPAFEERLAVNILVVGGLSRQKSYPEADGINYVSRIKNPTLMLNGRYDPFFPLEKTVIPFFKLLGTPEANKRLCIYETSHNVSKGDMTREVLAWCDKYLGPVK